VPTRRLSWDVNDIRTDARRKDAVLHDAHSKDDQEMVEFAKSWLNHLLLFLTRTVPGILL
jgi:hypothetical protein